MITRGNSKLGKKIWCWSMAAILTCPGATELCKKICYALRGRFYAFKSNYADNYRLLSLLPGFSTWMIVTLKRLGVTIMRVHVSGDFYSVAYIKKWYRIVKASPDVIFFAYTRSWRLPAMRQELLKLAALPNFFLWWSVDRESGPTTVEKQIEGMAYLSTNDNDFPNYQVDLVFRDKGKSRRRYDPHGNWICPYEQGIKRQVDITCTKCKYCYTDRPRLRGQEAEQIQRFSLPVLN